MDQVPGEEQFEQLRQKFEAQGLPWQPAVDRAVKKATAGIKDPLMEQVAAQVLTLVAKELERCLLEHGKNLLHKLWIRLKLKFTK